MVSSVNAAMQAGALAAQINAIQSDLAHAQAGLANGWVISKLAICDPNGNNETVILSDRLDPANSATALNQAIAIYQAVLTGLNAQLAAIT
jgi:hypothetical protein